MTALAVVTLAACGTERTGAGGSRNTSVDTVAAEPAAAPPAAEEQEAFVEMMDAVARWCAAEAPVAEGGPPAAPQEPLPVEEIAPDGTRRPSVDPSPQPELELNAADRCAGNLHVERIVHELWTVEDPTPAQVRKILNDLGYVDERIHGLKRSGTATRFHLDLRFRGGSLALDGSADAELTEIDMFEADGTGPFVPEEVLRKR